MRVTATGRSLLAALVFGLVGCAAPSREPAWSLGPEERFTYRYELIRSEHDVVCNHMARVYNRAFHRPWHFREFFRITYPEVFARVYAQPFIDRTTPAWSTEVQALWSMRYALTPRSAELDAIRWQSATLIGTDTTSDQPIRLAAFDIDNDGSVEIVVQTWFYGSGDGWESRDSFSILNMDTTLDLTRTTFYVRDLLSESRTRERFGGDIVRPFLLDGVTFLSQYETDIGRNPSVVRLGTGRRFRHDPAEKMWVKKYVGGQSIGEAPNEAVVCEFAMQRTTTLNP